MSIAVMNVFQTYHVHSAGRTVATSRVSRAEEKKDMVALSTRAKDYITVKRTLSGTPDIRSERVDYIKAQLQAGLYDVNAQMVAEKILGKSPLI